MMIGDLSVGGGGGLPSVDPWPDRKTCFAANATAMRTTASITITSCLALMTATPRRTVRTTDAPSTREFTERVHENTGSARHAASPAHCNGAASRVKADAPWQHLGARWYGKPYGTVRRMG